MGYIGTLSGMLFKQAYSKDELDCCEARNRGSIKNAETSFVLLVYRIIDNT